MIYKDSELNRIDVLEPSGPVEPLIIDVCATDRDSNNVCNLLQDDIVITYLEVMERFQEYMDLRKEWNEAKQVANKKHSEVITAKFLYGIVSIKLEKLMQDEMGMITIEDYISKVKPNNE